MILQSSTKLLLYSVVFVVVLSAGSRRPAHVEALPMWNREIHDLLDLLKLGPEDVTSRLAGDVIKFMTADWDCDACKVGVWLLQEIVKLNTSGDDIIKLATEVCITLKLEDERVCAGAVKAYSEIYLPLIRDYVVTPDEICGIFFGLTCGSPFDPFLEWSVKFPDVQKPLVRPHVKPDATSPQSKVLHLTDVHMDLDYAPGMNADCGEPLCCRKDDGKPNITADMAGFWGDYRYCDLPLWTLQDMLKHINKTDKFDYILWTGDVPAHDVWKQSRQNQLLYTDKITDILTQAFPNTPVYPTLGNHEGYPVNSFPLPSKSAGPHPNQWLYSDIARTWTKSWLPNDVKDMITRGAFYTTVIHPGLRIISLNTNYCHRMNWWLFVNSTDPLGMLQWLVNTLQQAEDSSEKVQIIGHIPPGENDCLPVWSKNFRLIVNRYESTIVGQFYGHTHNDHFEVFYDGPPESKRATNVAYIAPAVTPYKFMNSAYRVYHVDGDYVNSSRQILEMKTYFFNLTEANISNKPAWALEYSALEGYKMESLYPADWDDLVNRMETDETLFGKFYKHFFKMHPTTVCDLSCKSEHLCALRTAQSYQPIYCQQQTNQTHQHVFKSIFQMSNC